MSPICRSSSFFIRSQRLPFDLSIYLVANRPSYPDSIFYTKIEQAVKGGVSCIQLRDHKNDVATIIKTVNRLKGILKGVPLFINTLDPFRVLQEIDADGIYLEEKFPFAEARKRIGPKMIIGAPLKSIEELPFLEQCTEIDYLSVKVFPSKRTCPKSDQGCGMDGLHVVRSNSRQRIVAIGGLNVESCKPVYEKLFQNDGVGMAGGIMEEDNPYETVQKIREICKRVRVQSSISNFGATS